MARDGEPWFRIAVRDVLELVFWVAFVLAFLWGLFRPPPPEVWINTSFHGCGRSVVQNGDCTCRPRRPVVGPFICTPDGSTVHLRARVATDDGVVDYCARFEADRGMTRFAEPCGKSDTKARLE